MKLKNIEITGEQILVCVEVDAIGLCVSRYVGTRGARVAGNAEDAGIDTYKGGPFLVTFKVGPAGGNDPRFLAAEIEVRHDLQLAS